MPVAKALPMPQIFHRSMNVISRVTIFGGVVVVAVVTWAWAGIIRAPYVTGQDVVREQPVPFSHQHHVGGIGIDCRYCHISVEQTAFAGIPATEVCMNCHKQVWNDSPMLEPVRASLRDNKPLVWNRVNNLPHFVYFDHSIHIHKGVGCETCHGRLDRMPLTWKFASLHMEWCLNCHRAPENYLRPRDEVFTMGWQPPISQQALGRRLVKEYNIDPPSKLTNCSICHR
jgi:Cytochrome c7 and related cytochrome c